VTRKTFACLGIFGFSILAAFSGLGCRSGQGREVVVYTSVDPSYAKVIFADFEAESRIKVKGVFDVEATKSAGLANRLIAESNHPQADVFWSGEPLHILDLKTKGILEPYRSPSAEDIPSSFKDSQLFWTGLSGRYRVLIFNKDSLKAEDAPRSMLDLTDEKYGNRIAIANPLFGTTTFHFISLYLAMGEPAALDFCEKLKANRVRIVDGNSVVRKLVELGEIEMGLTDSDDADLSLSSGMNVGVVLLDQESSGALFIPNMVALIKKGPNPEEGRAFIDYLLSREADRKLADLGWTKVSVRDVLTSGLTSESKVKYDVVDYERAAAAKQAALKQIKERLGI